MTQLEKEVYELLMQKYNKAVSWFGENNIFGIFVCDGDFNMGTATNISEIQTVIFYIPSTFEDLCFNAEPVNTELSSICRIIDIRLLPELIKTLHKPLQEILYTDYYYINPIYQAYYKSKWVNNRDQISSICLKGRIAQYYNLCVLNLEKENYYKAYKYYLFYNAYINKNFESVMRMDKSSNEFQMLHKLKNNFDLCSKEELDKLYNEIQSKLDKDNINVDCDIDETIDTIIKQMLIELIKYGIKDDKPQTKKFIHELTANETIALKAILHQINKEGNISITSLVNNTGLSRPVFNNLILKMKEYKVAEIANQGAKGTHIKFVNEDIINFY